MTKARTAAQKRAFKKAAKRGRPKDESVMHREPNGRASRAKEPADKMPLEVRARMRGLSVVNAKDQRAESFIGTLAIIGTMAGGISDRQYEGLREFMRCRNDALMAMKAPNAIRDNATAGGSGDQISDEYVAWCSAAIKRYEEARKAVQDAQNETRADNLWAALDLCVIRDETLHHMIGSVRVLGNACARHFGLVDRRK